MNVSLKFIRIWHMLTLTYGPKKTKADIRKENTNWKISRTTAPVMTNGGADFGHNARDVATVRSGVPARPKMQ